MILCDNSSDGSEFDSDVEDFNKLECWEKTAGSDEEEEEEEQKVDGLITARRNYGERWKRKPFRSKRLW